MSQTATSPAVSYFIAVPGDDKTSGIYGIGLTHEAAVADAYAQSNSRPPIVSNTSENGFAEWHVDTDFGANAYFNNEGEARDYAAEKGFIARECTERLYRDIEAHGCDANHFRWTQTVGGLDDLDLDEVG